MAIRGSFKQWQHIFSELQKIESFKQYLQFNMSNENVMQYWYKIQDFEVSEAEALGIIEFVQSKAQEHKLQQEEEKKNEDQNAPIIDLSIKKARGLGILDNMQLVNSSILSNNSVNISQNMLSRQISINSSYTLNESQRQIHHTVPNILQKKDNLLQNPLINNEEEKQLLEQSVDDSSIFYQDSSFLPNESNIEDDIELVKDQYTYQRNIIEKVKSHWETDDKGSIIYLDTGAGKSYISIRVIKHMFGHSEDLKMLTPDELKAKREKHLAQRDQNVEQERTKKAFFLVPTNNLVEQQANVIDAYTDLRVGRFQGSQKFRKLYKLDNWKQEYNNNDVFVFIGKKFYDLLVHAQLKMEDIDLLIFDEAHHCQADHLYNLIMQDFFYPNVIEKKKFPKILGLTASPIKSKIQVEHIYKHEIQQFMKSLADNLYSRYVSVSQEDLDQMKNEAEVSIELYDSMFERNVAYIKELEQNLILKLLQLVKVPHSIYKVMDVDRSSSQGGLNDTHDNYMSLLKIINNKVEDEIREIQDDQVSKFINGRKKFIELDTDVSKRMVSLQDFKDGEERVIVVIIIMLLKNINNLTLELGPASVNMLLEDIFNDFVQKQGKLKNLKAKFEEILQNYIQSKQNVANQILERSAIEFDELVSGKVTKLIQILDDQYSKRQGAMKAIIFVKDRSVAEYLRRILELYYSKVANESSMMGMNNSESISEINPTSKKIRIGLAIGSQSRGLVSKAFKSTKSLSNTDNTSNIEDLLPTFSQVKLTVKELNETIEKFKSNQINVLIATSVIEEGLDISTCNLVVSINEILNVKSFIQTKGRARQKNSLFIFMCATEDEIKIQNEIQGFRRTIELTQQFTFFEKKDEISCDENVIREKKLALSECLITPLGAKLMPRDSPFIFDGVLLEILEMQTQNQLKIKEPLFQQTQESIQKSNEFQSKRLKDRVYAITKEKMELNRKQYRTILVMPQAFKLIIDFIDSDKYFSKKRESENYAYFLACKDLYEAKLLDDNLFPNLTSISNDQVQQIQLTQPQRMNTSQQLPQMQQLKTVAPNNQQTKKVQMLGEERKQQIIENQQFNKDRKDKNRFKFEVKKDKINRVFKPQYDIIGSKSMSTMKFDVFLIVLEGQDVQYPFKDTQDRLAILTDRDYTDITYSYIMQQENKQKQKNNSFLNLILAEGLINQQQYESKNLLQNPINPSEYIDDIVYKHKIVKVTNYLLKSNESIKDFSERIKFFHVWTFYTFYNAQHKFYKRLLQQKFTFSYLFAPLIQSLKKDKRSYGVHNLDFFKFVYKSKKSPSAFSSFKNEWPPQQPPEKDQVIKFGSYIVPLIKSYQDTYEINHQLIDQTMAYVNSSVMNFWFVYENQKKTQNNYGLMEKEIYIYNKSQEDNYDAAFCSLANELGFNNMSENEINLDSQPNNIQKKKALFIWNCESNHNLYSILSSEKVTQESWQSKQICLLSNKYKRSNPFVPERILMQQYGEQLTVQEHYFAKTGVYIQKDENQVFYKCSKMRHLLDFSKLKPIEGTDAKAMKKSAIQEVGNESINTVFDLPEELMTIAPLTYEQYHLLQTACFHMAQINEMIIIRKFILKFYKGIKIYEQNESLLMSLSDQSDLINSQRLDEIDLNQSRLPIIRSSLYQSAEQYFLQDPTLVIEALTSPNANRPIDYERLEFYGDSVISFLVILELFLCGDKKWTEGDLDVQRIKTVSNMNFIKINKDNKIYKYMITEVSKIYNDIIPVGFDRQDFQEKIKQKHLNEIESKIIYLRKLEFFFEQENKKKKKNPQKNPQQIKAFDANYRELVFMFITQRDLLQSLENYKNGSAIDILNEERNNQTQGLSDLEERIAFRWESELDLDDIQLKLIVVQLNIHKCFIKLQKEQQKRKQAYDHRNFQSKKEEKIWQPKQLADVVESIVGALTLKCGLFSAQELLMKLQILKQPQENLNKEIRLLNNQAYQQIAQYQFLPVDKVCDILNYQFKNTSLLFQALTHKSIKDQVSKSDCNDYERLEFLGDSILNFLVAQSFFLDTQSQASKYKPKQLHKKKTSIVNNVLLSLVVIETGMHQYIQFNQNSASFKQQFNDYVDFVSKHVEIYPTEIIAQNIEAYNNSSNQNEHVNQSNSELIAQSDLNKEEGKDETYKEGIIDQDQLYERSLKIFGDVFESVIGAVFLDSMSLEVTSQVLFRLLKPYITVYADENNMQDHKRTVLLELWNSKHYTKTLKIHHTLENSGDTVRLYGFIGKLKAKALVFHKDDKNKVRKFYKEFLELIEKFIDLLENKYPQEALNEKVVLEEMNSFRRSYMAHRTV